MSLLAVGALLGAVLALGLSLMVASAPPLRRPSLDARLAPYVRDTARPSRLLADRSRTRTPFPTLERLLQPFAADAVRLLDRVLGGAGSTRRRLDAAGLTMSVEQFRIEQLLWAAAGLGVGLAISLLALAGGHRSPIAVLLVVFSATLAGVVARDRWLTHQIAVREQRIVAEFPTVAEMLALAVAAGESPAAALDRVARTMRGELVRELSRALADTRAGASLVQALDAVARRTSLPVLARFVDGVGVALERGTPLADVLRAQAVDVRESGKRALMEAAGKKEIAMMVPVVFLILPVTMLFLLFPGFVNLDISTAP